MDVTLQKKINDFFEAFKHQEYKKGEILIRSDDNPAGVFFLKKGEVKKYTISKKGEELVVNIFKPNSFFPMSWAINNTTNNYYYEAMSDVLVYRANKNEVVQFLKKDNDVLFDLLSRVYVGLDGLLLRMVYLMSENADDRLIVELIIHAKRFGRKNGEIYEVETSEKDMASRSGMTRETVSREMKKLRDKGLVKFNKNLLIINSITRLEEELVN